MDQEKMHGVVDGFYLCKDANRQNINDGFFQRNIPDQQLESQFSFRAVPTKYVRFPALNVRPTNNISENRNFYEVSETFNPGNDKGPYSGYIKNIDLENNLRNTYFGLQNCNQSVYVPSSKSNLYNPTVRVNNDIPNSELNHPLLFNTQDFKPFNPDKSSNSIEIFNNHTRLQRTKK
jgi:hypothetical protein